MRSVLFPSQILSWWNVYQLHTSQSHSVKKENKKASYTEVTVIGSGQIDSELLLRVQ